MRRLFLTRPPRLFGGFNFFKKKKKLAKTLSFGPFGSLESQSQNTAFWSFTYCPKPPIFLWVSRQHRSILFFFSHFLFVFFAVDFFLAVDSILAVDSFLAVDISNQYNSPGTSDDDDGEDYPFDPHFKPVNTNDSLWDGLD